MLRDIFIHANCATWALHRFFKEGGAFRCRWVRDTWFPLPHLEWSPDGIEWYSLEHVDKGKRSFWGLLFIPKSKRDIKLVDNFYIFRNEKRTTFFPEMLTFISVFLYIVWFFATIVIWPMTQKSGKPSRE